MSEQEMTLQAFWSLAVVSAFIGLLAGMAGLLEFLRRRFDWVERRRRANKRWAEILTNRSNQQE